ncbi:MAG: lytic murein transglycosylase [Patescibacteria group bacterium]
MKPRILIEVIGGRDLKNLNKIRERIDFRRRRLIRFPAKTFLRLAVIGAVAIFFVFGYAAAPIENGAKAAQSVGDERRALELQLAELEKEIADNEIKISEYKKQGDSLKSEIKKIEAKISKLSLQIKAITLNLEKLDFEITSTRNQINVLESDIDVNKKNLSFILQTVYENDRNNLMEVLLKNPQLSDFFGDLNNLLSVQDNLRIVLEKIVESRQQLIDEKEALAVQRADVMALKSYQDAQKESILKIKSEKNSLLKITKGKESEYQKILTERKKTAAEIRKQIFHLLGGGELTFEKAYELAKFAESATGIRAAFILAVLDRESALGQNVGRCSYEKAMHPIRDLPSFLEIIKELGLEKDLESGIVKVSCANSDGAYGGAMGPAQFIPSTWMLYKDKVAAIAGNNPPSPWRNADAFVATALYLKDAYNSSSCREYAKEIPDQAQMLQERCAAAQYYAGKRWYYFRWAYGEPVVDRANRFQQDIEVLRDQLGVSANFN